MKENFTTAVESGDCFYRQQTVRKEIVKFMNHINLNLNLY